jgi:hypothetical protein
MKRGRRSRLDARLKKRVCALLRRGHTVGTVCASLGLPDRTFHHYCQKSPAFLAETQRARAQGRVRLVDSILDDRDWRGKAWYLERTAPDEFARVEARPLPPPEEKQKTINVAFVLPDLKGKSLQEIANSFPVISTEQAMAPVEPEPERTAGESFDGNISRLGKVEHDLPLDGNAR